MTIETGLRYLIVLVLCMTRFNGHAQYFNNHYEISNDNDFFHSPVYADSAIYTNGIWKNGNDYGTLFARITLDGDTVFVKRYLKDSCRYALGYGTNMIEKNGVFYIASGYRKPPSYSYKAQITKLNLLGDTISSIEIDSLAGVYFHGITFASNGHVALTGYNNTISTTWQYDVVLYKFDTSLNHIWNKSYGGADEDQGWNLDTTSDGGYVIGGLTQSFGAGLRDAYMIKTDNFGNFEWQQTYGGLYYDAGKVRVFENDEIVFYGILELNNVIVPSDSDSRLFFKRFNNGGSLLYQNLNVISNPLINPVELVKFGSSYYFNTYYYKDTGALNITVTNILKTDLSGGIYYSRDFTLSASDNYSTGMTMLPDQSLVTSGYLFADGVNVMTEDAWLFRVDSMGCFVPGCWAGQYELFAKNDRIIIFPNPSTGEFKIVLSSGYVNETCSLKITNSVGQNVYLTTFASNNVSVSLPNLAKGVYFVILATTHDKPIIQKVVIE